MRHIVLRADIEVRYALAPCKGDIPYVEYISSGVLPHVSQCSLDLIANTECLGVTGFDEIEVIAIICQVCIELFESKSQFFTPSDGREFPGTLKYQNSCKIR